MYEGADVIGGKNICQVVLVETRWELQRNRGHRGFFPFWIGEGREKEE